MQWWCDGGLFGDLCECACVTADWWYLAITLTPGVSVVVSWTDGKREVKLGSCHQDESLFLQLS